MSLFVAGGVSTFFTVLHGVMLYALLSNQNLISPDPMMVQALLQTFNSVTSLMVAAMAYFSFRYPALSYLAAAISPSQRREAVHQM